MMLNELINILTENEDNLIKRILFYSKKNDYTKYTSTLEEAWRISIKGISESIILALDKYDSIPDFGPDDDYIGDPVAQFGILEAKKHRSRGISLQMFLGLLKYYKQAYIDIILIELADKPDLEKAREFVERCFDRIELGFTQEWAEREKDDLFTELQINNRRITNEKNSYLTVFESLTDPAIIIDTNDCIVNLNYAAALIFNPKTTPGTHYYYEDSKEAFPKINKMNIIGSEITDFFPWLYPYLVKIKQGGDFDELYEIEVPFENEIIIYEIKYDRMLDISEKFAGAVITLRNITESHSTKEALRLSEEQLRTAFDSAAHGMVIFDPNGVFLKVNDAFTNIFGFSKEETIANDFRMITHPEDIETDLKGMREFKESGEKVMQVEKRYRHKNGYTIWTFLSISIVRDKDDNALHYLSQWIDITEKKKIEDELKKINKELEERVVERTEQLENAYQKMEDALEKEKEYNEMQKRFINMISHEYRTPLTEIQSNSELIDLFAGKNDIESIGKSTERIRLSVTALNHLVEDVIAFSKSIRESVNINYMPVNIIELINNIADEISLIDKDNHNIQIIKETDSLSIETDRIIIRQIVSHLLMNAMKYSPKETDITINIKTSGTNFLFEITDRGVGISESYQKHLFDPFYKSSESVGLKSGMGLGLPLVKKFIELMKGTISVKSIKGKGSTFSCTLPIHRP